MSRHLWNEKLKRWVWRCDNCGSTELWSDSWSWYGSYLDADAGKEIVACSDKCMSGLAARGEVPTNARRALR